MEQITEENTLENQKWKFALENSGIGVWDWNAKTNVVIYSKESKKIIGFKDDEISSEASEWDNRVHREDRADYYEDFNDHITGINSNYVNIHRVLHKDDTYRWILDQGKIIERDTAGNPLRIVGTHTDITKQKEAELSLKKSIDVITDQNNKLKSFAHIVSHNLKQHAGNFESILKFHEEADSDAEKQEMVRHLRTVSKSLSKTLNSLSQIVTLQSKESIRDKNIKIGKEVNAVIEELTFIISESSTIIYNNVRSNCNVYFSASYLHSILQNLITNAIKYKHPDRNPVITIDSDCIDDDLELTISDNGKGIDLEKFGKDIFGLYKTFHHNEDAEGVGLYLVKNQVEAFGGTISIDSKIDVGTTFKIRIPNHKKIQL
ncbi:sensor histidine kinase [Olleya namhaensis]|uniref:histidine kinase n=1 Tax=Olleya namhaensis TaxID=1144750 RepID=A0A1I3MDI9_9FLAO|nr:ATP-binding protein [Olleya namhaensis]SFI95038.1 PAS domain S-box-containing protein [Olleya namhaensis]